VSRVLFRSATPHTCRTVTPMCEVSIRFVPSFPLQCFLPLPASIRYAHSADAVCRSDICVASDVWRQAPHHVYFRISTYTFDFVSRLERVGSSLQTQFRTRMARTHIPHLYCASPPCPIHSHRLTALINASCHYVVEGVRRYLVPTSMPPAVSVPLNRSAGAPSALTTVLRYSPLHARPAFLCALLYLSPSLQHTATI
jgi:hypothetical protein